MGRKTDCMLINIDVCKVSFVNLFFITKVKIKILIEFNLLSLEKKTLTSGYLLTEFASIYCNHFHQY